METSGIGVSATSIGGARSCGGGFGLFVSAAGHGGKGGAGGDRNVSLGTDSKIETFATVATASIRHHGGMARGWRHFRLGRTWHKGGDVVTPGIDGQQPGSIITNGPAPTASLPKAWGRVRAPAPQRRTRRDGGHGGGQSAARRHRHHGGSTSTEGLDPTAFR